MEKKHSKPTKNAAVANVDKKQNNGVKAFEQPNIVESSNGMSIINDDQVVASVSNQQIVSFQKESEEQRLKSPIVSNSNETVKRVVTDKGDVEKNRGAITGLVSSVLGCCLILISLLVSSSSPAFTVLIVLGIVLSILGVIFSSVQIKNQGVKSSKYGLAFGIIGLVGAIVVLLTSFWWLIGLNGFF